MIAHDGPITLERYMSLCLGHPRFGYYMTRDPFGPGGDFVTAPEISQMFGEMLGVWITQAWRIAGEPAEARLVELGPGRGTLMADILRTARVAAPFLDRVTVHLIETSPVLRDIQRRTLEGAAAPISWHADVAEIPPGPMFVVANEFFDALPVRHFVCTAEGWRERLVGLEAGGEALTFGLSHQIETALTAPAREGSVIEIGAVGQRIMTTLARRIVDEGGALLAVDYGYAQSTLGDSLQAVARHAYVDPLRDPGEADLTAHVDFAALARAAQAEGAAVLGPATQGDFLLRMGVVRRSEALSRNATPQQRVDIERALERLAGKGDTRRHMGELFKVLAVTPPGLNGLPGFDD